MNEYSHQKIREIELELFKRKSVAQLDAPPGRRHGVIAPVVRAVGSSIRRAGEAIELWAFFSERDHAVRAETRHL